MGGNQATVEIFESTEGVGTSINVEGIMKGRNPKVLGRIHDENTRLNGQWIVLVPDGGRQIILVPSDKLTIG